MSTKPSTFLPETKHPVLILGWVWLVIGVLFILTGVQAKDIGDYPMIWTAFPIGFAYTFIGLVFIFLDTVFTE
jgi:hypothetical protein